jgi:hypothetical protein
MSEQTTNERIAYDFGRQEAFKPIQNLLADALLAFSNLDCLCYYHEMDTHPGRYHSLLRRYRPHIRLDRSMSTDHSYPAHLGLEILMQALLTSKITVRHMHLAVDLHKHHAFITDIPRDVIAQVCQRVETLVLSDSYYRWVATEHTVPITRTLFPKLRSLTIDHKDYGIEEHDTSTPLPSSSDVPMLSSLTIANIALPEATFEDFVRVYGSQARHLSLQHLAESAYGPTLKLLAKLDMEEVSIHHKTDAYWDTILSVDAEHMQREQGFYALWGLKEEVVRQAARTVTFSPPKFKAALERLRTEPLWAKDSLLVQSDMFLHDLD